MVAAQDDLSIVGAGPKGDAMISAPHRADISGFVIRRWGDGIVDAKASDRIPTDLIANLNHGNRRKGMEDHDGRRSKLKLGVHTDGPQPELRGEYQWYCGKRRIEAAAGGGGRKEGNYKRIVRDSGCAEIHVH